MIPAFLINLVTGIATKELTGSQTVGEALKSKTNRVSLPFLTVGAGMLVTEHWVVGVCLMFGSLISMTLRDTLAKLIKLYEVKNEAVE
jgi:hypothetical protein